MQLDERIQNPCSEVETEVVFYPPKSGKTVIYGDYLVIGYRHDGEETSVSRKVPNPSQQDAGRTHLQNRYFSPARKTTQKVGKSPILPSSGWACSYPATTGSQAWGAALEGADTHLFKAMAACSQTETTATSTTWY